MAARSNACSELTRFWLEARHGCVVTESVPVPVVRGQSDLDIVAIQSALKPLTLPDETVVRPRLIVETKDEHDFDPTGRQFGKFVRGDRSMIGDGNYIPLGAPGDVKFSMLRQQHYEVATRLFESEDFDRVFVVHALDPIVIDDTQLFFADRRIYWLTIRDVVQDLLDWYRLHLRPAGLRHSLMGDILHLLFGYCGLALPSAPLIQDAPAMPSE